MKKLLLLVTLGGCYSAHAQKSKLTPPPKDWRETVTPQQTADTLEALEAIYERARERYNILNALSARTAKRANDSIDQLRASQATEWSKVPAAAQKKAYKKKPLPR